MSSDPAADVPFVREEIARQPDAWLRAAGLAPELTRVLPRPGESVAVIGCGTSWFMATAYAGLREAAGQGWTDAFQTGDEFKTFLTEQNDSVAGILKELGLA